MFAPLAGQYSEPSVRWRAQVLVIMPRCGANVEDKLSVGGKELREIYEVINHAKAYDYA